MPVENNVAFDLEHFTRTRPTLYHLTATANLKGIRSDGVLWPAAHILRAARIPRLIKTKRPDCCDVPFKGRTVNLRDQHPLHAGNTGLLDGWEFSDFVAHLNEHVFFWPGTATGPISYGCRHFSRYLNGDTVVLVFDAAALIEANPKRAPLFCRYNSGSPRCTKGKPSPRGASTFRTVADFNGVPSNVVEVVFRGPVSIPAKGIRVCNPCDFVRD